MGSCNETEETILRFGIEGEDLGRPWVGLLKLGRACVALLKLGLPFGWAASAGPPVGCACLSWASRLVGLLKPGHFFCSQDPSSKPYFSRKMNSFFSRTTHPLTKVAGFAVGVGVVSSVVNASMYTVRMGERAVIFHPFGGRTDNTIVGEGTHFCIPWLQKPSIFNIRVRPYTFSFVSNTKDRQEVNLTVRVLFHPDIPYLPHNHQTLPSINHKDLDAVVSKFTSHELVANLMDVSALIREALAARATESHIVLDYVSFTNVSFSPEFSRACESEQVSKFASKHQKTPELNEIFEVAPSKNNKASSASESFSPNLYPGDRFPIPLSSATHGAAQLKQPSPRAAHHE
ncbi:prohibitin-4, mitochondrial-like [Cucurbita maxima]|uniref:Prohibitin n=1 Tax=Cucurbita maxima TaxID=3661 RepID=A0A6J1JU21_CUCMA|nr:prohibitin-4, mitochondrial-like [Cucurbita maxima]